ncbi:Cof-type HAD-IIB family hydrolase [Xylocopilactobacillus apis]|uniref:Sugar phosphate phosphatase n=1 Tax=Xylocopilactobacillus apis TaxID=2932183 RepID=A0AAU9D5V1_9LACO|nr:Cof-type HAD-IIB family hydrolase [Xylocopilactobacillus apis]BDR56800.1 sugar phosphate phosphatase [Xylocopilactobacillus apis]
MTKLICIDLDGTLLNDLLQITDYTKNVITEARNAGIKIVITSGRPLTGVYSIIDRLDLNSEDYVITYNGGLIQKVDGTTIQQFSLPYSSVLEIDLFNRNLGTYVEFQTESSAYTTWHQINWHGSFENYMTRLPLYIKEHGKLPEDINYIKAMTNDDQKVLDQIEKKIPLSFYNKLTVIRSSRHNIEYLNKQSSKGNAMAALAKKLNIEIEETMAIGDQLNDLSMINQAGIGVAMGNAISIIKQAAEVETNDNNHDGVAHAIEKYGLHR